jgi:hypothetical protein
MALPLDTCCCLWCRSALSLDNRSLVGASARLPHLSGSGALGEHSGAVGVRHMNSSCQMDVEVSAHFRFCEDAEDDGLEVFDGRHQYTYART